VIAKLNLAQFAVAAVADNNGHLAFTDKASVGTASFVAVSGTAAASLGFGKAGVNLYQRKAQGKTLFPSWQVYTPPNLITSRYPIFSEVVPTDTVFKVTYTVPGNRCLRCGSTLVENDIRFDSAGQGVLIENENLLYQASLKILLTNRGSNPYHPWYGSDIQSRIGRKAQSGVATLLTEDVRKALMRLQTLQTEQAKYQQVTFKERLYAIDAVQVQQHEQDPTTFLINVRVRNASSAPVNLSIVFTVPSVVALMGSNGLMLGTAAVGLLPDQAAQLLLPQG
jgi:phage baseplate assembly protein W